MLHQNAFVERHEDWHGGLRVFQALVGRATLAP
jgi:hypothetical protein